MDTGMQVAFGFFAFGCLAVFIAELLGVFISFCKRLLG